MKRVFLSLILTSLFVISFSQASYTSPYQNITRNSFKKTLVNNFVRAEMDPNGRSSFSHHGTRKFLSFFHNLNIQSIEDNEVSDKCAGQNNETLSLSGNNLSSYEGNSVLLATGNDSKWLSNSNNFTFKTRNIAISARAPIYNSILTIHGITKLANSKDGNVDIRINTPAQKLCSI